MAADVVDTLRGLGASIADGSAAEALAREVERMRLRAANGLRHLSGEMFTPVGVTPRTHVWSHDIVELYRYDATAKFDAGPVLIVHSLITRAHVFDLQPGSSLVEDLTRAGFTVYLLDWGVPGPAQAKNSLETYCDQLIPGAVDAVLADSERDSTAILGYCLGAVMAAISIAGNSDVRVHSLAMLAPPVDFSHLGVVANLLNQDRIDPETLIDETGNVPASLLVASFRMSQPTTDAAIAANYWQALPDKRMLGAHLGILSWSGTHIPFPGAVFRQVVSLFLHERRLESGVVPLEGGDIHLADLDCRVLCVTGARDFLVPPASSAALEAAMRPVALDRVEVNAGHAGLFVGRTARKGAVPQIIDWLLKGPEGVRA